MTELDKTALNATTEYVKSILCMEGRGEDAAIIAHGVVTAYLSTTSAGVTEEQTPRTEAIKQVRSSLEAIEWGARNGLSSRDPGAKTFYELAQFALACLGEFEASRVAPVSQKEADDDLCPVCSIAFKAGDTCATDIELGICHAECLEGSPIVDLDTGKPSDGPIDTYPYEPLSGTDEGSFLSDPELGVSSSPAARESEASAASILSPAPGEPGIKALEWLTRPIVGIENRTAQEVFDIMSDRIRSALHPTSTPVSAPVGVVEAATAARFARLLGICHRILWTDVGKPALDNEQTKGALDDLSEFLFADGLDEALRSPAVEGK